jgi:hypothetical protein
LLHKSPPYPKLGEADPGGLAACPQNKSQLLDIFGSEIFSAEIRGLEEQARGKRILERRRLKQVRKRCSVLFGARSGCGTYIDFHVLVKAVVHDQAMGHSNTMRFHWMACTIVVVTHIGYLLVSSVCMLDLQRGSYNRRNTPHLKTVSIRFRLASACDCTALTSLPRGLELDRIKRCYVSHTQYLSLLLEVSFTFLFFPDRFMHYNQNALFRVSTLTSAIADNYGFSVLSNQL